MNGLTYLRAAIFPTKTNFSRLPNFLSYIQDDFSNLPFDHRSVVEKLKDIVRRFEAEVPPTNQEAARQFLMAEDLRLIIQSAEIHRNTIENETDFKDSLLTCRDESVRLLGELGLSIDPPNIYIVEELPSPYERTNFAAMAPDSADEEKYGIPKGIYFLKPLLRPIYSRFMLVHEIIHSVLGESSSQYLGRGLEEGLAEIVGAFYLGSQILGKEIVKTTFYHNRLGYGIGQFWQLYLDYARMGTYLYNRFGMDGLVTMLKGGRQKIKEIEKLCFQAKYQEIKLPSGGWIDDITDLVNFITLTFSRDFVVSPLTYYTARYVEQGDTVQDIVAKSGLTREIVKDALTELQDRVFVVVVSDNRVDFADTQMLISANAMRYEV